MRDLLVHVSRYDRWSNSLHYAGRLGAVLKAAVTALYCVGPEPPTAAGAPDADTVPDAGPAAPPLPPDPQLADPVAAARAMVEPFRCFMGSLGVPHSDWLVHAGSPVPVLAHLGQWHDVLVVGAGGLSGPHPAADLARTLLVAHLTCLVVPEAWTQPRPPACIAVAWDGSLSALHALHAALPLLERAERVVLLLGGTGEAAAPAPRLPAFDLDRYCARHELQVERVRLVPPTGQTGAMLLGSALVAGAEMLVLGATGSTRMSERRFGDVDRQVLDGSPIPLLLRH